jgi:hypothetical protein
MARSRRRHQHKGWGMNKVHRQNFREKREQQAMSAEDAIELAESMDLPDGAFYAMVGELMGADGDEAYMTGVEAMISQSEEVKDD